MAAGAIGSGDPRAEIRGGMPGMRLRLLFGCLVLSAMANAGSPGMAAPFVAATLCGARASGDCAAAADPGSILPADWFDDLFGIKLPGGSWRDSCRHARVDGHFLNAECRKNNGAYRKDSFDLRGCGGDIAADNGKLFCERQRRNDAGGGDQGVKPPFAGKE
jgi:CVNH domain